ncbi:MAG TPA: phosphonopyruvate decarboxylase [Mobilitalea sp.]|nr:phosphonopyruvate decarboxylase [Mobilitalea sp.]
MLNVEELYEYLSEKGINYYTGVPDSQLKPFCDFITAKLGIGRNHIIAANEGNAVALAAGYHLATSKIGMVYMQNSGLGNAVNPITSLTDPEVYGIPVLYMIGWRGQPGIKDEPQHVKQGKITLQLLELLDIPYYIIDSTTTMEEVGEAYEDNLQVALRSGKSAAFIVSKNSFEKVASIKSDNIFELSREDAIKIIIDQQEADDIIVSTTGKASRELFEYRETKGQNHEKDFLTVGSMGHASMIAAAIAENTTKRVWCIDGDGAMIMHLGASAMIGNRKSDNLYHILLNNGAHETVGGMPTISYSLDWEKIVEAFGYRGYYQTTCGTELEAALKKIKQQTGPLLIEVMVNLKSREDLGRPTVKPINNKMDIMAFIKDK